MTPGKYFEVLQFYGQRWNLEDGLTSTHAFIKSANLLSELAHIGEFVQYTFYQPSQWSCYEPNVYESSQFDTDLILQSQI